MSRAIAIPAAKRRAHAVQALIELAGTISPNQITTAAIADRMGVSHAALFRHFSAKEDLWEEAVRWATGQLRAEFELIEQQINANPLEIVEKLVLANGEFVQQHPGLIRMLFAELQRPETSGSREDCKSYMQHFRYRLAHWIGCGQEQQLIKSNVDAPNLAMLLVASYQGLMLQCLVHNDLCALSDRIRLAVSLLLNGEGLDSGAGVFLKTAPMESPAEKPNPPA